MGGGDPSGSNTAIPRDRNTRPTTNHGHGFHRSTHSVKLVCTVQTVPGPSRFCQAMKKYIKDTPDTAPAMLRSAPVVLTSTHAKTATTGATKMPIADLG